MNKDSAFAFSSLSYSGLKNLMEARWYVIFFVKRSYPVVPPLKDPFLCDLRRSDRFCSMDYLLDRYFFANLPFDVTPEARKGIGQKALTVVQWADWFCKYESPVKLLGNNPYFLVAELLYVFFCALTFAHAYRHGGRFLYTWIAATIYAFNIESLGLSVSDLNLAWHAQGVLSFFGMRIPLYCLFGFHHLFVYTSYVLVCRMRLPWWAEGPAAGLSAVMLLLPFRILGTKMLWWTWHDTDPTIKERMFWVPWTSLYFYAATVCSFVWLLRFSRFLLLEREYDWMKFPREIICSFLAGVLSFWLGTFQFSLLYYPLHDFFGVHSEIATILFLAFYTLLVFVADRNNVDSDARRGSRYWFDELSCAITLQYIFLMVLVIIADPANIVSEGLHQAIGPCKEMESVHTPAGSVLQREKYLCATKYDEKYFDFHCVPNGIPKQQDDGSGVMLPLEYYPVCGTDFKNRAEYVTVIWSCCILFGIFFYQVAACSGSTPVDPIKVRRRAARQTSAISPEKNTVTVQTSPKSNKDLQFREPLISTKNDSLTTPFVPREILKETEVQEEENLNTTKKISHRRKREGIPSTTRVLRSRSYQVS
ncbi:hypothetical protein RB195_004596 [Necator americanus]|uniref:DUF7802 domain-containing protein n=1 Tax=Necator americanus TaxID=51031 RepID=A0ABR1BIS7_NECAM